MMLRRAWCVLGMLGVIVAGGCGDDEGGGSGGTGGAGTGGTGGAGTGGSSGTGGGMPANDCVDVDTPTGAATFDAVFDEVLCKNGCTDGFCHGPTGAGEMRLHRREAAYEALVGVQAMGEECAESGHARVVPFDAEASLLVEKLKPSPSCGVAMPVGAEAVPDGEGYVPAAQIAQIEAWINAGALRQPPADMDAGDTDASTGN